MKHLVVIAFVLAAQLAFGQKYFSKTGKITFTSQAPLEKIEAQNTSASTVLDIGTGAMEWAVLIKGFKFDKALMEEHFNENYMESSTYPKAKFKGKIEGLPDYLVDMWARNYSERLHQILRGQPVDARDLIHLTKDFSEGEKQILLAMNRAARFLLDAKQACEPLA